MTASEARAKAIKNNSQIHKMEVAIRDAVLYGRYTIAAEVAIPETISYFKELGYSIANETTNENGNRCVVSW